MITKIYFVRHAQPEHDHVDDRTRPLTREGVSDSILMLLRWILMDRNLLQLMSTVILRKNLKVNNAQIKDRRFGSLVKFN